MASCKKCYGQKMVLGMGHMKEKCNACKGTGMQPESKNKPKEEKKKTDKPKDKE